MSNPLSNGSDSASRRFAGLGRAHRERRVAGVDRHRNQTALLAAPAGEGCRTPGLGRNHLDLHRLVPGRADALSRDRMLDLFRGGEILPGGRTREEETKLRQSNLPAVELASMP